MAEKVELSSETVSLAHTYAAAKGELNANLADVIHEILKMAVTPEIFGAASRNYSARAEELRQACISGGPTL